MGAMTRMLLVVAAKLAVGGPGRLLGDEAGSEATKRVREATVDSRTRSRRLRGHTIRCPFHSTTQSASPSDSESRQ